MRSRMGFAGLAFVAWPPAQSRSHSSGRPRWVCRSGTARESGFSKIPCVLTISPWRPRSPSHFGRLTHLAYWERLRAFDSGLDRVTEFEMYGVVLSTYPVSVSSGGWPPEVAFLESGSLVIGQHILDGAPTVEGVELRQDSVLLLALHESATRTDTIGRFRGGESMNELRAFGEIRIVDMPPVPFGASFFVRALGSRVVVARSDRLELHLYSDTGRLEEVWRLSGFEFEVDEDDLAQFRSAPGINGVVPHEDQVERWLEAFPPSRLPAFSDLLVAEGREVWIKSPRAEDAGLWWVMDETGRLLGRVDVPAGLDLRAVASDRIAGVRTSALGVEHVEVYEMVR